MENRPEKLLEVPPMHTDALKYAQNAALLPPTLPLSGIPGILSRAYSHGGTADHPRWSPRELIGVAIEHAEALLFVQAFPRAAGLSMGAVKAVALRAFYSENPPSVRRFFRALIALETQGLTPNQTQVVSKLRGAIEELRRPRTRGESSAPVTVQIYWKVERALWAFLNDERLAHLYMASSEQFLFPGEDAYGNPRR